MAKPVSLRQQILTKQMLLCVYTGFMSGFPYYLLYQLVQLWLSKRGVDVANIGLFALVGLPYSWKFLWAPMLDRYFYEKVGRRRSWLLPTQFFMVVGFSCLGFIAPEQYLWPTFTLLFVLAWLSATQDVALDAYRREILADHELGLGNSIHVQMWRIAGFIPGSLSFVLAAHFNWPWVFIITAGFFVVGFCISFRLPEAKLGPIEHLSLEQAFIAPFKEFLQRNGIKTTFAILLFMVLYKLGDSMATALSTKFYLDIGFTEQQIGLVAKNAALWPMLVGGFLGGILMLRIGINRALWIFGVVQLMTILGFAILANQEPSITLLSVVVALEYLGVGLGTTAFTAFIARLTSIKFAATQFALLTAFAVLPRTLAAALTGFIVERVGWADFFIVCTVMAIPGMVMLFWLAPWNKPGET